MRSKTRRGVTLVELLMAIGIFSMCFSAMVALYLTGVRRFSTTVTDATLSVDNAQGLRHVADSMREAMAITISSDAKKVTFFLPAKGKVADPDTGEPEFLIPLKSDGVAREYEVVNGTLVDKVTNRVLVRNIIATDPLKTSSQYLQVYSPFQLTTIGAFRALTINLITSEMLGGQRRSARMKTTVLLRNAL